MRPSLPSILAAAAAVLGLACGAQAAAGADQNAFDEIVTRAEMAAGFARSVPFSFEVIQEDGARVYAAELEFARTAHRQHYVASVIVAAAGKLLDAGAHERRWAQFEREPGRGAEDLTREFPPIGSRAQRDLLAFGPGGAAFGLTFTTSDGRFDVKITVSNLLPAGVEVPDFRIDETARRISLLYDARIAKLRP